MKPPTAPPIRYGTMATAFPEDEAVDVSSLIPGLGDVELEIGYGRGAFLLGRATAVPASRVIGIELKSKWAFLVEERRKRLHLENTRAFQGDAREAVVRMRPDGALARVFVHFPDPWWKKRHAKRRVVDTELLDQLARLLRAGGELFLQTDVEDRHREMLDAVREDARFEVSVPVENRYLAKSNREARADADGLPVYRILATRRG